VLGLLDCIGELKRLTYDKIRCGNSIEAMKIFDIMEKLYSTLYPLTIYDKIIKEMRRKIDVNRILIEDTRSAITEEIRRTELIDSIRSIKTC
jgi:translin